MHRGWNTPQSQDARFDVVVSDRVQHVVSAIDLHVCPVVGGGNDRRWLRSMITPNELNVGEYWRAEGERPRAREETRTKPI